MTVSSLLANVYLKSFFSHVTVKYRHWSTEQCTRERNVGQLLGQLLLLHLPHLRDLWAAGSSYFLHAYFGIFFPLTYYKYLKAEMRFPKLLPIVKRTGTSLPSLSCSLKIITYECADGNCWENRNKPSCIIHTPTNIENWTEESWVWRKPAISYLVILNVSDVSCKLCTAIGISK